MLSSRASLVALIAVAGLAGTAHAQPIVTMTRLVMQGDFVPDVGLVTRIDSLAVNENGDWLVEVDTDNPNTAVDAAVLKNGSVLYREGHALAQPPGASIRTFDSLNLNSAGNIGWNLFLNGTSGGSDDSGIFFNDVLVLQESWISTAAAFSPGTPYIGFFEARMNDSNQIFVVASVDDPQIPTSVDRALVRIDYTQATGQYQEHVLAKEGDVLPGMSVPVADFGTGPNNFAFNNAGQAIYIVTATGTVGNQAIYRDLNLLALKDDESPVPGRTWTILSSSSGVELSNTGHHVYTGRISGDTATNLLIVRNGQKFRQTGDPAPSLAPWTLQNFGSSQIVYISDDGDVLWYGDWDDPDTTRDTGLFLNDHLLIQKGVTTVDGMTITQIFNVTNGYRMSRNGRFVIVEVNLDAGGINRNAAILLTLGEACYPNCDGSTVPPILNVEDFTCFINEFAAGTALPHEQQLGHYANCDRSTVAPVLNVEDFTCFINRFAQGCQ
jgi:hypothetical protein